MFLKLIPVVLLASFSAFSSAQTISGRLDCIPAGSYTLCQNLWGSGMFKIFVYGTEISIDDT